MENYKVLLVDDDPFILKSIALSLEEKGYRVTTVDNGQGAIDLLNESLFDLILTDLVMGDVDGFQVLNAAKKRGPEIMVIIMTGYGEVNMVIDALRLGADDYTLKPCEPEELFFRMKNCLEKLESNRNIRKHEEELRIAHDELETKVEERTRELTKLKEEAETANRLKTEFLANMSHELRTPLHHILNYSLIGIKRIHQHVEKSEFCLHNIVKSTKRMAQLVDSLLDLSKLEAGKVEYEMVETDIWQLCHDAISEFKQQFDEKGIVTSITRSLVLTRVICDSKKIGQVLQNLLSNLIKYSGDNQKITIHIEKQALPMGKRSTDYMITPTLLISIKDEGPGVPEDELELIFDRFTQSSNTKTGAGGTGLGLAICDEIIKAHKGKIWAENNPEKGVSFSFLLPFDPKYSYTPPTKLKSISN